MLERLSGWVRLVAVCLPVAVSAQTQSWEHAFEAAQSHDPTYLAAKQAHRMTWAQKNQATAAWNPEMTANGAAGLNHLWQEVNTSTRQNTYTSQQVGVQWRKPLFNKELEVQERQATLRTRWADWLLESATQELGNRLVEAALRWQDANLLHRQAQFEWSHQQRTHAANQQAQAMGESTLLETLEGLTRLRLLEAQLNDTHRAVLDAKRTLEALTGGTWTPVQTRQPPTVAPHAPLTWQPPTPEPEEYWLAQRTQHPDWKARQEAVEVARAELERITARYKPRLDGVANLSRSASDTVSALNQKNTLWAAGLQLNWPLYAGGRDTADTEVALAALNKAEAERDTVELKLSTDIQSAWQGLQSVLSRLGSLQEASLATEALAKGTEKTYLAGQSKLADNWAVERQAQQLQTERLRLHLEAVRLWWRLHWLTGQGNARTLLRMETLL